MRVIRPPRGLLWAVALLLGCIAGSTELALGQSAPSSEQLQIFQGLSPEQQQAILESMSKGGLGGGLGTSDQSGFGTGDRTSTDQFGRPRTFNPYGTSDARGK